MRQCSVEGCDKPAFVGRLCKRHYFVSWECPRSGGLTPIEKTCIKCGKTKPIAEFSARRQARDGYRNVCRACQYGPGRGAKLIARRPPHQSMKPCSVEGCPRPHSMRGLCRNHYYQAWEQTRSIPETPPGATKACIRCRTVRPLTDFAIRRGGRDGRRNVCRKCVYATVQLPSNERNRAARAARQRDRRHGNPKTVASTRRHRLKKFFGLTEADYEAMVAKQRGVCAICHRPETAFDHGRVRRLSVDHDHATGFVRGLLCAKCNAALGQADDSPDLLLAMAVYIENARAADSRRKG